MSASLNVATFASYFAFVAAPFSVARPLADLPFGSAKVLHIAGARPQRHSQPMWKALLTSPVPGRQYPVDNYYVSEAQEDYLEAATVACVQLHMMLPEGDILCFLTGREEIEIVQKAMSEKKFPADKLKVRCAHMSFPLSDYGAARDLPDLRCAALGGAAAGVPADTQGHAKVDPRHQHCRNIDYHQ